MTTKKKAVKAVKKLSAKGKAVKGATSPKASKAATSTFVYDALTYAQRDSKNGPTFVLFHAPAGEISEWADVDRLSQENRKGAQRQLRKMKVTKVRKFMAANAANTIPTSVVVALDGNGVEVKKPSKNDQSATAKLTIKRSVGDRPALIIDGQHRVFGVAAHDPKTHLNVIGILGGDDAERAFQFIVINNTPARVSKDHIRALNLNYDTNRLNDRLVNSAGLTLGMRDELYDDLQVIDHSAPFKGLLSLPTNPDGFIPPNALEGALAEIRHRKTLLGIEEYELDVFLAIWVTIKSLYPSAWNRDSRLLNKVPMYALTVFVAEGLKGMLKASEELDLLDEEELRSSVSEVLKHIPLRFWTMQWEGKELDTSLGRRLVLEALDFIDANGRRNRPWYQDVGIIDTSKLSPAELSPKKSGVVAKKAQARKQLTKSVVKKASKRTR